MGKIELTNNEINLIHKYLKGELGMFSTPEDEQNIFMTVIDKAEALMIELDAAEESGDDLIAWFWEKYQNQEN